MNESKGFPFDASEPFMMQPFEKNSADFRDSSSKNKIFKKLKSGSHGVNFSAASRAGLDSRKTQNGPAPELSFTAPGRPVPHKN